MDDRLLDLFESLVAVQLESQVSAGEDADVEDLAHACVCYRCTPNPNPNPSPNSNPNPNPTPTLTQP